MDYAVDYAGQRYLPLGRAGKAYPDLTPVCCPDGKRVVEIGSDGWAKVRDNDLSGAKPFDRPGE